MKRIFRSAKIVFSLMLAGVLLFSVVETSYATYDPLSVPNNKFGIHILDPNELDMATDLVNSSGGQWGYVVIVIQSNDRNKEKWQQFFDKAREKKVIPIVRIATKTREDYWEKPEPGDAEAWANFLADLHWPTSNHYIIAYNEPNSAKEWGKTLDPQGYAHELVKTINAIKAKDDRAFILNAGFDAAAPTDGGLHMDEAQYLDEMAKAEPDVFKKIDGWSSHSYPQPEFSGSPNDSGRNTITTYRWETQLLKEKYGRDHIPVFITETGWAHQTPENQKKFHSDTTVAQFFQTAYQQIWQDSNLVAVVPFTLQYKQQPFTQFSWIREAPAKILGVAIETPFFPQFLTVKSLPKVAGQPIRKTMATLINQDLLESTTSGQVVSGKMKIKNTGETVWYANEKQAHVLMIDNKDTTLITVPLSSEIKPGQTLEVPITFLAPQKTGNYTVNMRLMDRNEEIATIPYQFAVNGQPEPSPDSSFMAAVYKWFSMITNQQS